MKQIKRIIAGILTLSILLTMVPLTVLSAKGKLYGDVNSSGAVDKGDADDLRKFLAEYEIEIDGEAADVNLDKAVDLKDLLLIEKFLAGYDIVLGNNVTLIFNTNGGTAVEPIMLCNGAVLTDFFDEPFTEKDDAIFMGWVKSDGEPFFFGDPITESLTLTATFEPINSNVSETPMSFALEDQAPDLSYAVISDEDLTAEQALAKMSLTATDGSEAVALKAETVNSRLFTVSAVGGFNPGCTYELLVGEGLHFKDKAKSIRKATFIIHKDEIDKLKYNSDIKYIKDTDEMSYTLDGSYVALPVLDIALISNGQEDTVSGSFEFNGGGLEVGNTLCIFEDIDPRNRDYTKSDYQDDSVAFIKITAVNGIKISFKGLEDNQATDVIFMPDTIPFSVAKIPTTDTFFINSTAYDTDAWHFMGRGGAPEIEVGDFVVLYSGKFEDMTDTSDVYYGEVTAIEGLKVTFKKTTSEAIAAANDVFLSNPMSGDDLLKNVDTESVEGQIEKQTMESGFASDTVEHLIAMAAKTDNFESLSLENVTFTDSKGADLSAPQRMVLSGAALKKPVPKIVVKAKLSKNPENFDNGIRLELGIDAEFSIALEDGDMKFSLHATFVEEIYVKVNLQSHARVKWYLFIPVLKELTFGATTDIKNFTSLSIDLRIYTVEESKVALWDKYNSFKIKHKVTLDKINSLEKKLDEATEPQEKLDLYAQEIKALWLTLPAGLQAEYNSYCDELGEINMSSMLNKLLKATDEKETDTAVQALMDRYSKMMKSETEWVTLVDKQIFKAGCKFIGGLVAVNFSLDFVIKANVNISLGVSMEYMVGKRYAFWIDIIDKTSGSSVTDLVDEKFAFKFYVMGYIGLKMGVKATVSLEILWGLAGIGISGEFGPYIKLWGYFIYTYTKMRPMNTDKWDIDTQMAGALYLEFGIYVTISFNVEVVKKTLYNPNLYDKEFPILSAGVRKNVYRYSYAIEKDEGVFINDHDSNSNNGIDMILPESYRLMQYIDLVEGNIEKSVYDYSNFAFSLSNSNFSFDDKTGNISVTVPKNVRLMKCNLTLTWRQGKLSFSKRDLRIVIPLVWTNLSDSELKQRFTVTVNVGNEAEGYTPLWSSRVMKNECFNLPTTDEILALMNYPDYGFNGSNLKYESVTGYGPQPTEALTTYTDAEFYFNTELREYTLSVGGVQSVGGSVSTEQFKANFGEQFKIQSLKKSGFNDPQSEQFTSYYHTKSTSQSGAEIDSDLGRAVDVGFAKALLGGATYTAEYVDNSVKATFKFEGDVNDIKDKTVKIKRGSTPPDLFTSEVLAKKGIVKSVSPKIGNIISDTTYTVIGKKLPLVMRTISYMTNGGSPLANVQFPEEGIITPPIEPEKEGYSFSGWFSDEMLQIPFVFDTMPNHDIILYAKWSGDFHQLTLDGNGGVLPSGITNPICVQNGATYGTFPSPTRAQFKFDGWYTARVGGSKVITGEAVHLLEDTTLYARWAEKSSINGGSVNCAPQIKIYNQKPQEAMISVPSELSLNSFAVFYKRQGLDSDWHIKAENAGVYDVKISRAEDGDYKAFEKVISGAFIINKAESAISTAPVAASVYYGNITPAAMAFETDYVGEKLEYAASASEAMVPTSGWTAGAAYNIYDSSVTNLTGNNVYLWARVAESENYLMSQASTVSAQPVTINTLPKALISAKMGDKNLYYRLTIKTSNIDGAGTNSKIYVKIGDGDFQHLDADDRDDFEKNSEDVFYLSIKSDRLYNMAGGAIPVTLKYVREGSAPGWHCAWIRLDVCERESLPIGFRYTTLVTGDQKNVGHWFGANDYDRDLITELHTLTGYERAICYMGSFTAEASDFEVNPAADDYEWAWTVPSVMDGKRGVGYNPYEHLNAPQLSVSFNHQKYNRFITQGVTSFSLASKELYSAMAADGVAELTLTYSLGFIPLNGVSSVDGATGTRTRTVKITRGGARSVQPRNGVSSGLMSARQRSGAEKLERSLVNHDKETFSVSYRLNTKYFLWGIKFAVNYDSDKVELLGYTLGDMFEAGEFTPPERYDKGRFVFLATRQDFEKLELEGVYVTLHFKVKESSVGNLKKYPVSLDEDFYQAITHAGAILGGAVRANLPELILIGNTIDFLQKDTLYISYYTGLSKAVTVRIKKDSGEYVDITASHNKGYLIKQNGSYTVEGTTDDNEIFSKTMVYSNIDRTAPGGEIVVGENKWEQFLHTVTFGLFFDETKEITISSNDSDSGVSKIEYFISRKPLSETSLSLITDWQEYTRPFKISPDSKNVIYAKLTDRAGNVTTISTDGIVLDSTPPAISGAEGGKVYCAAISVTIADENLDTVKVNGTLKAIENGKLRINTAAGSQTIVATDKAGNSTTLTVTVKEGHTWNNGGVTKKPTTQRKGIRTFTCIHCGETMTEEISVLIPEKIPDRTKVPPSGENQAIFLWIVVLFVSCGLVAIYGVKRRKSD